MSLGCLKGLEELFKFILDNFDKLNDWWHVDQLPQFILKKLTLEFAYFKAR